MLLKNGSLENRAARLWTVWIILVALILVAGGCGVACAESRGGGKTSNRSVCRRQAH